MLGAALVLLASAQPCDLVLRGGRLLDPGSGVDRIMDVAVSDGKIAVAEDSIDAGQAKIVVDARVLDEAAILWAYVRQARERGIVFDVGHGAGSFVFRQARLAMEQGFPPDTISTDLHRASMNGGMKDMLNVMSKLLSLGMPIEDAVRASTSSPARAIGRDDIGHLRVGGGADVAVLSVREGKFGFVDVGGERREGNSKLECELTLRAGKVVWDLNGISASQGR